jgi:hypothetical protein
LFQHTLLTSNMVNRRNHYGSVSGLAESRYSKDPRIRRCIRKIIQNPIGQEGDVEGGIRVIAHDTLACVDGLLRFNSSNQVGISSYFDDLSMRILSSQSYFREISLLPVLCQLLLFPPNLQMHEPAPRELALQFWDEQKSFNLLLVVGIMGMLISSKRRNISILCYL